MRRTFASAPWGRLDWVLDRLAAGPWDLLGALSNEERCTAVPKLLRGRGCLNEVDLIDVNEPPGHRQAQALKDAKALRALKIAELLPTATISALPLLVAYGEIVRLVQQAVARGGGHMIIDITALPKRFFFPAIKIALRSSCVQDIVVAYAHAERYAAEPLHEDAMAPEYLPLFSPAVAVEQNADCHIVGLGFEAPGLIQVLEGGEVGEVEFLFPLPAPPPLFGRNWDALRHAVRSTDPTRTRHTGVSGSDVAAVFDELCSCTRQGQRRAMLAPYGPKPVSLAMCLFALAVGSERAAVIYTQPKYYHPHYSNGIAIDRDGPVIYGYPIRLDGRDIFTV